jgi:hypothetical protein
MCLVCDELATSQHWAEVWPGNDRDTRLGQHHSRAKAIRQVLAHFGLAFDEELGGSAYVIGDAKGHRIVCRDIDAIWQACDDLLAIPVDPLDPALVAELRGRREGVVDGEHVWTTSPAP